MIEVEKFETTELAFLIAVLNRFSKGGCPMATAENVKFFELAYALKCAKKAKAKGGMTPIGETACKALIAKLERYALEEKTGYQRKTNVTEEGEEIFE